MKLGVLGIMDRGKAFHERLQLSVLQATDLSFYTLFFSRYNEATAVSAGNSQAYWFAPQIVKPGDHVFVFSSEGKNSSTSLTTVPGAKAYFYYLGYKTTIWQDPSSCVVVQELTTWATTAAS